jgi:hypothetical protein
MFGFIIRIRNAFDQWETVHQNIALLNDRTSGYFLKMAWRGHVHPFIRALGRKNGSNQ